MTLVERCARLKERIDWSSKLDARSHEAARIGERKETVDHVRGKVRSAVDRAAVLREAVALDAGDTRVHYLLGRVCYEQGDEACGDEQMRLTETKRGH